MFGIMLIGAAFGAIDLWRPIDGTTREMWRECDVGSIARNYYRDGMHFLYPQVDWRGDGPGYVEMEFPVYPYMIAVGYKVFGFHEQIGRVLSFIFTLVTLFLVLRLAEYTMPPPGAALAALFYAVSPLTIRLANAIQPEPLMMMAYVGAVYAFIRWLEEDRWLWYWSCMAFTALAILAKAPAAHLGVVYLFFLLWRGGWAAFKRPRLWVLGAASLVPGILWYAHARNFYKIYGNSLGASNHQHVVGLATFTDPKYILGIATLEYHFIWHAAGLVALLVGAALVMRSKPRWPVFGYAGLWYLGILVFYLVIAGTSSYDWARYYHIVSMAPAALLIGGIGGLAWARWRDSRALAGVAALASVAALVSAVRLTWHERHWHLEMPTYETAKTFEPLMQPGVLIAASGHHCISKTVSDYNTSWYFYWTDHKGFTPCVQEHTMANVQSLIGRGARYFIVEQAVMAERPDFAAAMRATYPALAETKVAVLFKLEGSGPSPAGGPAPAGAPGAS